MLTVPQFFEGAYVHIYGARAARVLALLPSHIARVHLSGLGSADAVGAIAASNVDAALIGEALMRVDDPGPLLSAMVAEARRHAA